MTPVLTAVLIAGYLGALHVMGRAAARLDHARRTDELAEEILAQALAVHTQVERERAQWAEVCELERLFLEDEQ